MSTNYYLACKKCRTRISCPYHGWMNFPPTYNVRESIVIDALMLARVHLGDPDELGVIANRIWDYFRGTTAFREVMNNEKPGRD